MSKDWEDLDTEKLLRQRRDQQEQTTSAGVGGYETPLGAPLRPPIPPYEPAETPKKKKQPRKK